MHYTTTGEAATDRTKVGFQFAKDLSPRKPYGSHFFNGTLLLPAGAPETRVDADITFVADATRLGVFRTPMCAEVMGAYVELPDGTRKQVLSVPRYDFNWQTYYMFKEPLQVPKGSRLVSSAWA